MDFYKIKKKSKYNTSFTLIKKINLNINTSSFTFNSMCSFSKGFMKKDKNGKLRHYESYASYQNAMNHLKTNYMVA